MILDWFKCGAIGLSLAILFVIGSACSDGTGFNASSLSSADAEEDPNKKETDSDGDKGGGDSDSEGSDVPVWVNGSYLTCQWDRAIDAETAQADCRVMSSAGSEPSGINTEWEAIDQGTGDARYDLSPQNESATRAKVQIPRYAMLTTAIIATVRGGGVNANPTSTSGSIQANAPAAFGNCVRDTAIELATCFANDASQRPGNNALDPRQPQNPTDTGADVPGNGEVFYPDDIDPDALPTRDSADYCEPTTGQCFWFSAAGQSCSSFCGGENRVHIEHLRLIGSPNANGGSSTPFACSEGLGRMMDNGPFSYNFYGPPSDHAVGCGYAKGDAQGAAGDVIFRRNYIGVMTTPDSALPGFHRVCPCIL